MMMMMMGIRMIPVVIYLPQRLIHALVLQPPFPCALGRRICISKVTLDTIGNAEDATMIVIITVLQTLTKDDDYHRSILSITNGCHDKDHCSILCITNAA